MFQISFEGRRRQDIYISIREPSSQGAGRPAAFHPVRSAAAGRSEGDGRARRNRETSETTGQERPRRPTKTQNRRNHGARPPLRRAPAGHRTRGSEARAPPNPTPEAAETPFSVQKSGRGFGFSKFFSIFVPRQTLPKMKLYGFAYFFYSFFFYAKRKCGTPCIG